MSIYLQASDIWPVSGLEDIMMLKHKTDWQTKNLAQTEDYGFQMTPCLVDLVIVDMEMVSMGAKHLTPQ
jgi:hypothetical protein